MARLYSMFLIALLELNVPLDSLAINRHADGALEWNTTTSLSAEDYQAVRNWEVKWTGGMEQFFSKSKKDKTKKK